jgi:hypothetical protein
MGKTMGIVGLGALGKAIAHLALAYKMQVVYFSPHHKPYWEEKGVAYKELPDLLAISDIVVLSGPSNLVVLNEQEFNHMRPGSILLQASIGTVLNKNAFLKWISRDNNFAIFDYAAGDENYTAYKDLPNVIFPQVIAGHSRETKERLGLKVVENLKNYIESVSTSVN